ADGKLAPGVTAKDLILAIIGRIGTAGGTGYAIEFAGDTVRALSMEGRMTMCNMAIEAGARAGMIAVDERTLNYIQGRPLAPAGEVWDRAAAYWRTLVSDPGATFDLTHTIDAASVRPQVTWGTSPEMVVSIEDRVPDPDRERGCSMCLAMNDDRLDPGERCASTSNRNFEGRQGAGGRTHLVSPAMAAAAAVAGRFVDVRRLF